MPPPLFGLDVAYKIGGRINETLRYLHTSSPTNQGESILESSTEMVHCGEVHKDFQRPLTGEALLPLRPPAHLLQEGVFQLVGVSTTMCAATCVVWGIFVGTAVVHY